ncbi:MAG: prolipoprotein diacylglyceryl transferase [Phycisphaerales bacterium]|jgi:phosphatidylglycerol:prolipoprotein diacylglycerol transferase|nr:prolipoprotein diacylglyceryl transferase [Phycisphaerales bacterium]
MHALTSLVAESYLHRLDPVAIPLSPTMGIRWYGLAYLAGFVLAWVFIRWMARTDRSPLSTSAVGDLMVYAVVGVIAGGRLGYALFYNPAILVTFTSSPPWWELLAIHRGGMASHGGIIGVAIAMVAFAVRHRLPALHLIDLAAIAATPGLFLGRLANFINGELWGKRLSEAGQMDPPWWSVKYPEEVGRGGVDLTAASVEYGSSEDLPMMLEAALRAGDARAEALVMPHMTAYWPSQLIQAFSDGPVLLLVLAAVWWRPRKPGVVCGWFAITYGVLRILTEFVRQPDEGVAILAGLQRGQLLSVFMIIAGIVIVWICSSRTIPPIGGLAPLTPVSPTTRP